MSTENNKKDGADGKASGKDGAKVDKKPCSVRLFVERWGATIEKAIVYLIAAGVLTFGCIFLHGYTEGSSRSYDSAVRAITQSDGKMMEQPAGVQAAIVLLSLRDASVLRGAMVFVAFIFALMGCILLLKGIEASLHMGFTSSESNKAVLRTASPGIVLILAALVLLIVVLPNSHSISLESTGEGLTVANGRDASIAPLKVGKDDPVR